MAVTVSLPILPRLFYAPRSVFSDLAQAQPSAPSVFFKLAIWLLVLPPLFAFFGSINFGWNLGADEPVRLSPGAMVAVSAAYFFTLVFGFITSAVVSRWMASTYGASENLGLHFSMLALVGAPLLLGSAIHLYPHAFVNLLVLAPALLWSMYLLYTGLPIALGINPQRGMLMASALIGYLLVASVSLLGLTVVLWGQGIGPEMGI
ncbi:MAG: Yip1 family protein [Proteobacteria bacterium]|nr:Yip1 family protein [Pseudomonadota bacterium]